jgi:hypothetical protein
MIKKATGDWKRRIRDGASSSVCDVRGCRGPYKGIEEEIDRKKRAMRRISVALNRARDIGAEYLILRCGERSPRRIALQALLREYLARPEQAVNVNSGRRREYTDRLVLALNTRKPRSRAR